VRGKRDYSTAGPYRLNGYVNISITHGGLWAFATRAVPKAVITIHRRFHRLRQPSGPALVGPRFLPAHCGA